MCRLINIICCGLFNRLSSYQTKPGTEGEQFSTHWAWEEVIWAITKPIPSSASHCLRLLEWSQEFLRDLPVCGGRTWIWDHIEIPYMCNLPCLSLLLLFSFTQAFSVFVACSSHPCAACTAQKQVAIYKYSVSWPCNLSEVVCDWINYFMRCLWKLFNGTTFIPWLMP